MKLPDDLAAVFTTRASSPHRSRLNPASTSIQSGSREVGVILQPLRIVSTEELDGYLSSLGVDSRQPTEILDYDDFGYYYDFNNLDDFDDLDEDYEDNYTPLFFGVFMADNEKLLSSVHDRKPSAFGWSKSDKPKSKPDCSVSSRSASDWHGKLRSDDSAPWHQDVEHEI
uniref:OSJNBa0024J22.21 protein n=1 Tax=Oryza sativa subsp. japonica TaxID=39947 RepID=Q7XNQ7_ORYSJ|nr:OSJNBa0024J22.21 [Oryza sativa Japonica Group]CAE03986.3 OSJNBa0033H08.18 [Oryza sativa Japonica Group]